MEHTIGAQLHDARLERGLSVAQLAEAVRLRPQVVKWLEQDDFTPCGPIAYVRGYLRCLASYLDLPADDIVALYTAMYEPAGDMDGVNAPASKPRGPGDGLPPKSPALLPSAARPWLPMLWFLAVVLIVGALGYALLANDATQRQPMPTTSAGASIARSHLSAGADHRGEALSVRRRSLALTMAQTESASLSA